MKIFFELFEEKDARIPGIKGVFFEAAIKMVSILAAYRT
jgi:hypothetical protein